MALVTAPAHLSLHLDILPQDTLTSGLFPWGHPWGKEELGWGGREEREAEAEGLAMQVGELEDKRASGWGVVWGLSQGTEGQPVRVRQEFPGEAAGPLGSYMPFAWSSLLRPGEGVNLRSPQVSCHALKQPPAPGDPGSHVNNLKP